MADETAAVGSTSPGAGNTAPASDSGTTGLAGGRAGIVRQSGVHQAMIDCEPGTILPPPSEAHVQEVESFYGIKLPQDYHQFLVQANGCTPVRRQFRQGNRERMIERFLPILDDAPNDTKNGWADVEVVASQLDSRLASDLDGENIDLIPVAALFAGDFIVLDYRGNGAEPSVAVWDHEASDDFNPAVETVSASFAEFLDRLQN